MRTPPANPELSRPFALSALKDGAVEQTIEANEAERRALAARFGIQGVERLRATVAVESRQGGDLVIVHGRLDARVRQICVVSLDPFESDIAESFEERFVPVSAYDAAAVARELELDPLMDEPEPLEGDVIDLGELVAQTLSLALDPYPRKPGLRFEDEAAGPGQDLEGEEEERGARRPFDALARLRK